MIVISDWAGFAPPESDMPAVGAGTMSYTCSMMGSYARPPSNAKCDYFDGSTVILFGAFEPGIWSVLRLYGLNDSTMKANFLTFILAMQA